MRDRNVVRKFAFATRVGFVAENPEKKNQDTYLLAPNLSKKSSMHLFGVADGHGQYGHEVADFVKFMLPDTIEDKMSEYTDETNLDLVKVIKDSYKKVHANIAVGEVTDADFSGSTLCSVIAKGRNLYAANVGDSRAILITAD